MSLEITVRDTETGETTTRTITDDYCVITHGNRYIDSLQVYPGTGTAQIVVKTQKRVEATP